MKLDPEDWEKVKRFRVREGALGPMMRVDGEWVLVSAWLGLGRFELKNGDLSDLRAENRVKPAKKTVGSRYRGVHQYPDGRWCGFKVVDGKRLRKTFKTEEEALQWRLATK